MIHISSGELRTASTSLRSQISQLQTQLDNARAQMHAMEGEWSSPASRAFVQEYDSMIPLTKNYLEAASNFAFYLEQTAAAYEQTEQALAAR